MGGVAITVTVLSPLLVGIARVALNVHYPSDLMAGWSLGYLYFLLFLLVFRPSTSAQPVLRCTFVGLGAVTQLGLKFYLTQALAPPDD